MMTSDLFTGRDVYTAIVSLAKNWNSYERRLAALKSKYVTEEEIIADLDKFVKENNINDMLDFVLATE